MMSPGATGRQLVFAESLAGWIRRRSEPAWHDEGGVALQRTPSKLIPKSDRHNAAHSPQTIFPQVAPSQVQQHRPQGISHFVRGQRDAATVSGQDVFEMELQ